MLSGSTAVSLRPDPQPSATVRGAGARSAASSAPPRAAVCIHANRTESRRNGSPESGRANGPAAAPHGAGCSEGQVTEWGRRSARGSAVLAVAERLPVGGSARLPKSRRRSL